MKLFKKGNDRSDFCAVQTAESFSGRRSLSMLASFSQDNMERRLYSALRESVPIINGAIDKIVRLTGGFQVSCKSKAAEKALSDFLKNVRVGANSRGISCFVTSYLNQLLTYGTAVAEIVPYKDKSGIAALYIANLRFVYYFVYFASFFLNFNFSRSKVLISELTSSANRTSTFFCKRSQYTTFPSPSGVITRELTFGIIFNNST